VVRIDDRIALPTPENDYSPAIADGVVLPPLELVTHRTPTGIAVGINGLIAAREFWDQFVPAAIPDIVLADIDFEFDLTSPLRTFITEGEVHIPTGLCHCKPFAAVARANGRPLVVMLHTADSGQWREFVAHPVDRQQVFGLLAAQEVVELAGILGETIVAENDSLAGAWRWIEDRTHSTPRAALEMASIDYRRQVVDAIRQKPNGKRIPLRVGTRDWKELREWCQGMQREPRLLGGENDVGLPLLYPDGHVDRISFASLFADVRGVLDKPLPPECFDFVKAEDPSRLRAGLPQIGAFIAECGDLGLAADAAASALTVFPLGDTALQDNLRSVEKDSLALGLAVLFRVIQVYRADDSRWERIWTSGTWDPRSLAEVDDAADYAWAKSVKEWVALAEKALTEAVDGAEAGDDEISERSAELEIIAEKFSALTSLDVPLTAVNWHLGLLCALGAAESWTAANGASMYRPTLRENSAVYPPRPLAGTSGMLWESNSLAAVLRDSLGFGVRSPGAVNDNAIGQLLYDAFVSDGSTKTASERAKAGREFLERFRDGDAPEWIRDICRTYCRDILRWENENNWPLCVAVRT
jgi:hypothetical protein